MVAGCITAALIMALAASRCTSHTATNVALAIDSAAAARATADSAVQVADAALIALAAERDSAHTAAVSRDSALKLVAGATRAAAIPAERFRVAALAAPDTCAALRAAADSALMAKDSIIADLRSAVAPAIRAAAHDSVALDTAAHALVILPLATVHLEQATTHLEHAARPNPLVKLLPRLGFGLAAGFDRAGTTHAIAGLTLGWVF